MASSSALRSGIKNYARYLNVLAGSEQFSVSGTYELLQTTVLSTNEPSVTFSSLNSTYGSTYKHLQLRMVTRNNANDTALWIGVQFNGDSGSNYGRHYLVGTGSAVQAATSTSQTYIIAGESVSAQITSGSFASTVFDIYDPFNTSKNTMTRSYSGQTGSRNRIWLHTGVWLNTAALTSIAISIPQGGSYIAGSRFSLYGIKAS